MKKINLLFPMIWAVLLLASCVKEDLDCPFKLVKEGVPVQMTLNYTVDANRVVTRAAQESEYEFSVHNLYVFIFDSQGAVHYRGFFDASSMSVDNGDETNPTTGNVSFETTTVNNAKIVGIANLTTTGVAAAYQVTKTDLDNIETLDALEEYVMTLRTNSISRGASFMMTGYGKGDAGSTDITISADESGNARVDCTLKLERTDAKVEFLVTSEAGDPSWSNFTFTPKTWNVMQVPSQSLLLPAEEVKDAEGEYFDVEDLPFEDVDAEKGTGSFVFYMPENRKSPKKAIEGDDYALRDLNDKQSVSGTSKPGQTEENLETFTYANDNSTYVVLTGNLSYQTQTGLVNADVRYVIHLGYASGDVNDYQTLRNTHYTYHVTVKGVNDIFVEVQYDKEERPGHEGDVVISMNGIYELDSHYDRILISISESEIDNDMTWAINTPMGNGVHQAGSKTVESGLEDYKWIKFAINKEYGQSSNLYVKYPGDQNYSEDYKVAPARSGYFGHPDDARLWDVHQLILHLKEEKTKGNSDIFEDGSVYITAFIDENLYWDDNNRQNWKISVDKEDRQLHIVANTPQYSPDGNSSLVSSLYTFKQKAIRTVYNVAKPELQTAWGLESVMETGRLVPYSNNAQNMSNTGDKRNGRNNTIQFWEGRYWTDVLNTSDRYGLNSGYEFAVYACLMRNRDLNGDNKIQAKEIRWYLAAVDQLTDIYLGEYALDEESRLYPSAAYRASVYWHYTSSTFEDGEPWVIWSEEGATRGKYSGSYGKNGMYYAYRCIRNLGMSLDETGNPEDLVKVTPNGDGSFVIDMSNMSTRSRRSNYEVTPLPNHDEKSDNNRPYEKFEVGKDAYEVETRVTNGGEFGRWDISTSTEDEVRFSITNDHNWIYYQTHNPCPEGYRMPNYREMLIMTSRLPKEEGWPVVEVQVSWWERDYLWSDPVQRFGTRSLRPNRYVCQTGFSLNGDEPYNNGLREGYLWDWDSDTFFLQNNRNETGYVRCVRDLQ